MPKAVPPKPTKPKAVAKKPVPAAKVATRVKPSSKGFNIKAKAAKAKEPADPDQVRALAQFTGRHYIPLTPLAISALLHLIATTGHVTNSCNALGINYTEVYRLKANDEAFKLRFNEAQSVAADSWEDEAARRAFTGYDRPVYQQGMLVGQTREYSDNLATFLLKGAKPEKHRERASTEVLLKGGVTVGLGELTDDELNEYINTKLAALGCGHL